MSLCETSETDGGITKTFPQTVPVPRDDVRRDATVCRFAYGTLAVPQDDRSDSSPKWGSIMLTLAEVRTVSPALERYTRDALLGDVWKRPGLSPPDRSIVTLAALIAGNQAMEMAHHFNLALDNGVKPRQVSEIITHLAFYSGWAHAMRAVAIAKDVFAQRGIGADQLPAASPQLLHIDEAAERQRAARVESDVGPVSSALVQYTTELLFHDLWLRPDLAPRDRSLVTVSALIASGQVAQIAFHLNKAMDNGLTKSQVAEALSHLAFYAGWPKAMSAVTVIRGVFDSRQE